MGDPVAESVSDHGRQTPDVGTRFLPSLECNRSADTGSTWRLYCRSN
jgi:hypothetical protein